MIHGEPDLPLTSGEPALAIFRPEAVALHRSEPGQPRNHFSGVVSSIEPQAHLVRIRVGI